MHQVGFARSALLPAVLAGRKEIGASQQIEIGLRMIAPDLLTDFFDANHKNRSLVFDLRPWPLSKTEGQRPNFNYNKIGDARTLKVRVTYQILLGLEVP